MPADKTDNQFSFDLKPWNRGISDEELLADLQHVAALLDKRSVKRDEYNEHGKCHSVTLERRFGSWNAALVKAGLSINVNRNISDQDFFENLERVWITLGRQPRISITSFIVQRNDVREALWWLAKRSRIICPFC